MYDVNFASWHDCNLIIKSKLNFIKNLPFNNEKDFTSFTVVYIPIFENIENTKLVL
jgi:hypothetical protein